MAMLYYSIVMVSIGSLSTGSPSVSSFSSGECENAIVQYCYGFNRRQLWLSLLAQPSVSSFSSGECMGQCHTTVLLWFQYLSISKTLQLVHTNKTEYRLKGYNFLKREGNK